MSKKSFPTDPVQQDELLEDLFNQARKDASLPGHRLTERLLHRYDQEKTSKRWSAFISRRYHRLRYQYPVQSLVGSALLLALIIYVGNLAGPQSLSKPEAEPTTENKEWQVKHTSLVKREFLDRIAHKVETDTVPTVGFFHKDHGIISTDKHIPLLKVSKDVLMSLGFTFSEQGIVYEGNVPNSGYFKFTIDDQTGHGVYLSDMPEKGSKSIIYPWYVSDINGRQTVRFKKSFEDKEKMSQQYFNQVMDNLVPIAIPHYKNEEEYVAIFWFNSSVEIFEALTNEPYNEVSQVDQAKESEASELQNSYLRVNPNPFYGPLNVSLRISEPGYARLDLISTSGRLAETLIPRSFKEAGEFNLSFDLNQLENGIYLLVLTTGSERIMRRILKQ